MVQKTGEITFKFHHFASIFLVALVATVALYLAQDITSSWDNYFPAGDEISLPKEDKSVINRNPGPKKCDFYSGNWIYDDAYRPPYEEKQCPFMEDGFACEKYGRKDLNYRQWRWQPHNCNLPRFNGTAFMERIRGKKLMFVGDSMARNIWASMLCLIQSSLPSSKERRAVETSPNLVESNCDDKSKGNVVERVVRIHGIERHARNWDDSDILVFNSYAWWLYPPKMTILWGSFDSQDLVNKTADIKPRYYEMAMNTLSDWLEMNVNRTKTQLFFMSPTPYIFKHEKLRNCYNVTKPTFVSDGFFSTVNMNLMDIAEETVNKLGKLGLRVEYVRISQMSAQRRDAHPSIYRKFNQPLTEEDLRNPKSYADCIHWCLPGVPDFWNRMLYAHIMRS